MYSISPSSSPLVLDKAILFWVLLPIVIVMFLQGILRQYVSVLLREDKPKTDMDNVLRVQTLRRSGRLRGHASFITSNAFNQRKKYFIQKGIKDLPKPDAEMPASDPSSMVGMMKQHMAMIVPNMLLMGWVSYFFAGFVLVKLPFHLTDRFKAMMQRGIALNSLDVSYVSSLSWYFMNVFGLRGILMLVLGGDSSALDNPEMAMAMQMQGMAGGPQQGPMGPQPDYAKIYKQEIDDLEIVHHDFVIAKAEQRLIAAYRRKDLAQANIS